MQLPLALAVALVPYFTAALPAHKTSKGVIIPLNKHDSHEAFGVEFLKANARRTLA